LALVWAVGQTGIGREPIFNPGGIGQMLQFARASLQPDLSPVFLMVMLRATGVTFAYAVCGTVLSLLLGLIGGLLSAEIWWRTLFPHQPLGALLGLAVRGGLVLPRAIHELIWGLFLINILGLDPLVAVLAIAIPFGAIVAKVFSEILDETPHQPLQALLNAGVPPLTAFLYGLLPQALPNLLSYSFYRFECSLRSSAVLGIIGAGGLGYEIFLSLQSLRYEQLWTGFYALILLNGSVDAWSAWVRGRLGLVSRLALNHQRAEGHGPAGADRRGGVARPAPRRSDALMRLCLCLTIPLCFWRLHLDWTQLWAPQTWQRFTEVMAAARPAGLSGEPVGQLLQLSGQTVAMSILAIVLAGGLGMIVSFPAARNLWLPGGVLRPSRAAGRGERGGDTKTRGRGDVWLELIASSPSRNLKRLHHSPRRRVPPGPRLRAKPDLNLDTVVPWTIFYLSRLTLLVSRAIPAPIWALVFLFGVFPGILPGALALGVHNFGILGRLMAEVNENLDDRPVRSLRTLGAPSLAVLLYGMLPQTLPQFSAYILYRWEVCLRETVIVGLVGAGGLGRLMTEQLSSFDYSSLTLTLGAFIILTFAVDLVSTALRRTLR
jgi:phosphonate transport system permease protein